MWRWERRGSNNKPVHDSQIVLTFCPSAISSSVRTQVVFAPLLPLVRFPRKFPLGVLGSWMRGQCLSPFAWPPFPTPALKPGVPFVFLWCQGPNCPHPGTAAPSYPLSAARRDLSCKSCSSPAGRCDTRGLAAVLAGAQPDVNRVWREK